MSGAKTATGIPLRHEPRVNRDGSRSSGMGRGVLGFWVKIDASAGPNKCWPWTGYLDKDGYGKFCTVVAGMTRTVRPHRHAYEQQHGTIPEGRVLMHLCDNRACCNPAHLRPGTQKDNIHDCMAKKRFNNNHADVRGELHPKAKLTEEAVRELRESHATATNRYGLLKRLHAEYGPRYGISYVGMCGAIYGVSWKHLRGRPSAGGGAHSPRMLASKIEEAPDLTLDARNRAVRRARDAGELTTPEIAQALGLAEQDVLASIVRLNRADPTVAA